MPDELPPQTAASTPVPPPPPFTSVTAPAPAGTGLTPNVAAGLAAIFTVIGGIIFLIIEKRDQFVRFWAMQSVFFGVAWFVCSFAVAFLAGMFGAIFKPLGYLVSLAGFVVQLGFFAVWVVTIIQAFSGKEWEIPVLGKLARQQLTKAPTLP